jgi:predicted enzyme related to lactoylglutathione lyase
LEEWGGAAFRWASPENPSGTGTTVWSPFKHDTTYFAPSTAAFMVNFRVDDLHALLAQLRSAGCDVDAKVEESEFGAFGWVMDPDGNKIELWQPPAGQ